MLSKAIDDYTNGNELFLSDKERLAVIIKYNDIKFQKWKSVLEFSHMQIKPQNILKPLKSLGNTFD